MGCMYSSAEKSDRTFRVYNVDESGDELNSGKIQVTDVELILHQKGKESIRWPLRCLRRYGCDQELFSFESGRRCPTGPGIYAFKCRRAETLFATVQDCIQRAGQQEELGANQAFDHNNIHSNSRPSSMMEMQPVNPFVVQPGSSQRNDLTRDINYINVDTCIDTGHQYVNINTGGANGSRHRSLPNGGMDSVNAESVLIDFLHNPNLQQESDRNSAVLQYSVLDLPASTENLCEEPNMISSQSATSRPRMESEPDMDGGDDHGLPNEDLEETLDVFDDSPFDANLQPDYINVGADGTIVNNGNPGPTRQSKSSDHNYLNISHPGRLNYIEVVNLTNGTGSTTPTSPVSYSPYPAESPSNRTDSYTVIDFAKTQALSNSSRVMSDVAEEGLRKTRHNSTITS